MSAITQQIVALAHRGFDAAQIASALGLREEDVMTVVTRDAEAVKEIKENGLEKQFAGLEDAAMKNLEFLMHGAENEAVRLKAAQYIIDQRLGKFKPKERVTVQNNFQFLIERFAAAKEKAKEISISSTADLVNV
jgi:hypothetical protein